MILTWLFFPSDFNHDKLSRDGAVNDVRSDVVSKVRETFGVEESDGATTTECFNNVCKQVFRDMILEGEIRCDGRNLEQIRNIACQVSQFIFAILMDRM